MEPLVHPSELSTWQCFLQARRVNQNTSRSKNAAWYKSPRNLDAQLHLFLEGTGIVRASHRSVTGENVTWTDVEPPQVGGDEAVTQEYFASYFETHLKKKHRSLGVILHLADEFAISELTQFTEAPEDYRELQERLLTEPREVLEDHTVSVEDLSFRLMPYRGQDNVPFASVAITISRRHHQLLRQLRNCGEQANFPIRTMATSAPLEALASLPHLIEERPSEPFCVFLAYQDFSVVAFFNENSELALLRSIRHHSGGIPDNAHVIVQTMAVSLELADPKVILLCLSQQESASNGSVEGAARLNWQEESELRNDLPLEFQVGSIDFSTDRENALQNTRTFGDFAENEWPFQDFLPPTLEEEQLHPGAVDMKILAYGKLGVRAAGALLIVFLAFLGVRAFQVMRDPAWHTKAESSAGTGNALLQNDITRFDQWDGFLEDRSKAWVTMELISRIFPDPSAVVITEVSHQARPEAVRDLTTISMVKDWKINGYANDTSLEQLTALNTREGISEAFKKAHRITGDGSLDPDLPSRSLVVNLLASENKRYDPDKGPGPIYQFPFTFTLTISQRISSDDPLAIPAAAAP